MLCLRNKNSQPNLSIDTWKLLKINNIEMSKQYQASDLWKKMGKRKGYTGQELTHDFVIDLAMHLGMYFGKGPIVVGYDGTKSTMS